MDQGGVTWIVIADATGAKVFVERVRAGAVHEAPDLAMTASDDERGAGRGQRATVHQRTGSGRHSGDQEPAHEVERRFMKRIATRLALEAGRGSFDHLVLMGPPHALGALRQALTPALAARVEVSDPHERKRDDAEAVRLHLREARARSGAAAA